MKVSTPVKDFREIYGFYKQISGSHSGIINNKIYQTANPDAEVSYFAMTSEFPQYERLFGQTNKIAYHLSGYGCEREEAFIRLIGESIERYSVVYAHEMLKKEVYYASYNQLLEQGKRAMSLEFLNVFRVRENDYVVNIGNDEIIGWIRTVLAEGQGEFYVPAQMFFLGYLNRENISHEGRAYFGVSTGTAAHTSAKKALENALVEYLQIDSFMLSWYAKKISVPRVILDEKMTRFLKENKLISDQYELLVLDYTLDKPFPIFGIFIISDGYPFVSFGVQGGADPYKTLYRGLLEAATILQYNYSSYIYDKKKFELGHNADNRFLDLDSNVVFWATEVKRKEKEKFLSSRIKGTIPIGEAKRVEESKLLSEILAYCRKNEFEVGCYDITCRELGMRDWHVIRTIIPGLLPMCLPGRPFDNHPRMQAYGGCHYEFPHPLP